MKLTSKIFSILLATLCAVFALSAPFVFYPRVFERVDYATPRQYKGIVEMWHVETFEGGSASRTDWLNARAREYEKQHPGTYVYVRSMSVATLADKIVSGETATFDIVSFSYGCGEYLLPYLSEFCGKVNTRADLTGLGCVYGKQMALPLILGGYVLAGRQNVVDTVKDFDSLLASVYDCKTTKKVGKSTVEVASVGCGFGLFNSPIYALDCATDKERNGSVCDFTLTNTQYTAYEKFLKGDFNILLGTQRDLFRLTNRQNSGSIGQLVFQPLGAFTDLIQYVGLSSSTKNADLRQACVEFVEYLTSDKAQKTLSRIGMFDVIEGLQLYEQGEYELMEQALDQTTAYNVFLANDKIASYRQTAK